MSLVPTNQNMNLPAYLVSLRSSLGLGANIAGGISLGGESHPRISIRQNRFRLVEKDGTEEVWDDLSIHLVILDSNPNVSKRYYAKAYDPTATEPVAPDCSSDNGKTPNAGVPSPQATNCASCAHNVWGSKITPSGKATKACGDSKRLAVVLAEEIEGTVYELSVPGASLKDLAEVATKLENSGIPVYAVIFKVTFDATAQFPKLSFKPVGYIDVKGAAAVEKHLGEDAIKKAVGMQPTNDEQPTPAFPPRATQAAPAFPPQDTQGAPANVYKAPTAPPQAFVQNVVVEGTRRKRRTKAEMEAARGTVPTDDQPDMFGQGDGVPNAAPVNAAQATVINPAPTSADLDALLAGVFN